MKACFICGECGCDFARIENGTLIIMSRHHGKRHTNYINIARLAEFARDDALPVETNSLGMYEGGPVDRRVADALS